MMNEIKSLPAINPVETLFVVDAMTGQDTANIKHLMMLTVNGGCATKAMVMRDGAALSVRHITGKPIKFIGMGEKTDALEPFHPDHCVTYSWHG